jgi:hypothetical protein
MTSTIKRLIRLFLLLGALLGSGCGDDEQTDPAQQNPGQSMQATAGQAGSGGAGGSGASAGSDVASAGAGGGASAGSGDEQDAGSGGSAGTSGNTGAGSGGSAGTAGNAGAGGSAGSGGSASEPGDSLSCDPRMLRCRRAAPTCREGTVPEIIDGCYGECVPIDQCVCDSPEACPNPNEFTCINSTGRCSYYL